MAVVEKSPDAAQHGIQLWFNRLFHCNPFYPLSALLLLFSIYRISTGPQFLGTDTIQIMFSFSTLQVYSLMLVATAIVLAKRSILYDATLLVILENVLLWVPFMLVSHATFIEGSLARALCGVGAVAALLKITLVRRQFRGQYLPMSLIIAGLFLLAANIYLPLAFRDGLEFANGVWTNNELWRERSIVLWYLAMPMLALLGLSLPNRVADGWQEKRWMPVLLFGLWIIATATHLYSIGYVDDQKFTPSYFVPLLWGMSWVFCLRAVPHIAAFRRSKVRLLAIPALVPVLAAIVNPPAVSLTLFLLDFAFFGLLAWRAQDRRPLLLLATVSAIGGFFAVPEQWIGGPFNLYGKEHLALGLVGLAGVIQSLRTHSPRGALLGSISGLIWIVAFDFEPIVQSVGVQLAFVYPLLHSLWWKEPLETGSEKFKGVLIAGWLAHSIYLQYASSLSVSLVPTFVGLSVTMMLIAMKIFSRRFAGLLLGVAMTVSLIKPTWTAAVSLKQAPDGVITLIGSFLLFAMGTLFAFKRRHFSPGPQKGS